jgi:ATP-dependent helicase HrpB
MRAVLPVDEVVPEIVSALTKDGAVVVEAPPGAGKTTRVPPALLDAVRGDVLVLEPRRLATRMAARRVAEELGEPLGQTVGYKVRFEEVGSARTRLWFLTEGVLTRRLVSDPRLEGVGAVVLDEFHERHLHGDVALALLRRLRRTTRPDLGLVVMSATLDAEPVKEYLACRSVVSMGRAYDVALDHLPSPDDRPLASQVTSAIRRALTEETSGHVLVFLPGMREIRQTAESAAAVIEHAGAALHTLHGDLSAEEQDRAVRPSEARKVILSTNVAESSVTIPDVACVVDAGLVRRASTSPWSGLSALRVVKASRASCTQRAGRAGRTRSGRAYRLFTKTDFDARPSSDAPELQRMDLAQTVLELKSSLGGAAMRALEWLDAPTDASLASAEELLLRLGAVDARGEVTELGRRMLAHPVHPRLARVLEESRVVGDPDGACTAAAILGERDLLPVRDARVASHEATEESDVERRVTLIEEVMEARSTAQGARAAGLDVGATLAVIKARDQLRRSLRIGPRGSGPGGGGPAAPETTPTSLRRALLAGYIDRVARRVRPRSLSLALAGGGTAELAPQSVVRDAPLVIAVDAEERADRSVLVRMVSAIEPEWLFDLAADRVSEVRAVEWDASTERAVAIERMIYDGLVLDETRRTDVRGPDIASALADAAIAKGITAFAPDLEDLFVRLRFAAEHDARVTPLDDAALHDLITRACEGSASFAELRAAGLGDLVRAALGRTVSLVDRLAPSRVTLGRGRAVRVSYEPGKSPWIESRMQDFFGMKETPRVAEGKVPLVVHLLAPNHRAVQITQDLAGFWTRHYPTIRKELMRKYPRHQWPEDPG